ncbi:MULTISPECIES: phosphoadenylyl-sulfate reductase [unclassified Wenzhouxiangella]|uniref:phosphoadenylyl-sulfate reductase n=1 Tax=unclassified Wenzhouxiangella TaxID=2613841 RepID=UPI000E32B2C8|nr:MULTISPECIES: phosphoadenylyl-sulfate reductase [unclassified Wenzhouxiangella]RFF27874.1 phosphoadenylyl-sulfate reductase [Wenzhouxiangella sp. 15181]RFP68999.1 phosphoadenylyl-sulfate reductase [Wenzhouxiangella sp. 15190]
MSEWKELALNAAERKAAVVLERLSAFRAEGKRIFVSSSFQTQSLPLLHIVSRHGAGIPVVFLDTGYLFPETLTFRDAVAEQLGLEVINVRPSVPKSQQRTADGRLLFAADTDKCCALNKVEPLAPYLRAYDIWMSGVRADQSAVRSGFAKEQEGPHGIVRYHPMLDWTAREIYAYREAHDLPEHPLQQQGYLSIGCMPCTRPISAMADDRDGRWSGQSKTECGLHTDLGTDEED